jgi:hypothetical protein
MIAYTSTMMDALRPARISERGINSVSPFRAPSNQVHIHDHNRALTFSVRLLVRPMGRVVQGLRAFSPLRARVRLAQSLGVLPDA